MSGITFPLAEEAMFNPRYVTNHALRAQRHPCGSRPHYGPLTSGEDPDECWETAGARAMRVDPNGEKALARLRKYLATMEADTHGQKALDRLRKYRTTTEGESAASIF